MIPTMQGAVAQCAMCKASVESNVADGNVSFAAKLNLGILYLFVTPYLLAIVIGYLWYRKSRDNARKLEKIAQRKRRLFGTN
jgi:hypothetical protein